MLCDYKAARSERLTTHILKVHNKRACTRCNFLADDQAALTIHVQENHPLDHRNNRNVHNRNTHHNNTANTINSLTPINSSFGQLDMKSSCSIKIEGQQRVEKPHKKQAHGADRLFSYLEASDHESSPEDETTGNKPPPQQQQPPPTHNVSRPSFPPDKIPNPHQNLTQFKPQDHKKMGDFSKMFFNNQFLGEGSKYIPDPTLMKSAMQVNYFSEQNLVFNKFLDEEKNLYYPNLPDSKNMFLNHHNFPAPTPNPFFTPPYIDKAKSTAAIMNHPTVTDVTKMYKHPDFFKAGNVVTQDDKTSTHTSLVNHVCRNYDKRMISCRTFPAKNDHSDDTNKENVFLQNFIQNISAKTITFHAKSTLVNSVG